MPVAINFPRAPSTNASLGVDLDPLLLSRMVLICSNTVYWIIGLATNIKPGITPLHNAERPSDLTISSRILTNPVARWATSLAASAGGRFLISCSLLFSTSLGAVSRVLTTQMGFVRMTVADPAINPASILSAVVKGRRRPADLTAAFSRNSLLHSYQK